MKTHLALLAFFASLLAAHATPVPGAQSNVKLALTLYETEPVSDTPTLYKTKIAKYTYTSRDLLTDLLAEGLLGEGEVLDGWKLVVVDRTPLFTNSDTDGNTLVFYAVKAGKTPVHIPAARFGINPTLSADALTQRFSGGAFLSRSSSFKAMVEFTGRQTLDSPAHTYDDSFNLTGLATGADSVVTRKLKEGDVTYSFSYILLGAVTIKPVLGTATDHLDEDSQVPIEGSITFSAFTAINIADYPYAPAAD